MVYIFELNNAPRYITHLLKGSYMTQLGGALTDRSLRIQHASEL